MLTTEELQPLSYHAAWALREYARLFEVDNQETLTFPQNPVVELAAQEKAYAGKAVVPAFYCGTEIGELVALIMDPKDGTGSEVSYKLDQVKIPDEYQHQTKPERIIPRDKDGIIECFFPLFSECDNLRTYFAAHLDELILGADMQVKKGYQLGQSKKIFNKAVHDDVKEEDDLVPRIQLTTSPENDGFGDPHAIYNNTDVRQVVAFLKINEEILHQHHKVIYFPSKVN